MTKKRSKIVVVFYQNDSRINTRRKKRKILASC